MDKVLEIYKEILFSYEKYQDILNIQGKAVKNGKHEVVGENYSQIQSLQLDIEAQQKSLINQYKLFNVTPDNIKKHITAEQYTKLENYINNIDRILKECTNENENNQQLLKNQMAEKGRELINIYKGKKIAGVYSTKIQDVAKIIDRNI